MQCSIVPCARNLSTPSYANFTARPLHGPQIALTTSANGTTLGNAVKVLVSLEPTGPDQLPPATTFQMNYYEYNDIALYLQDLFTTTMSTTGLMGSTNDASTSGADQTRQRITPGLGLAFGQAGDMVALMAKAYSGATL